MARYKKIDVRIWNDAKFNALSSDARLIFPIHADIAANDNGRSRTCRQTYRIEDFKV